MTNVPQEIAKAGKRIGKEGDLVFSITAENVDCQGLGVGGGIFI